MMNNMHATGGCAIMDAIGRILTLQAVSGGLTWSEDLPEIRRVAAALDEAEPFGRRPDSTVAVNGMYLGCEDFCAVYAMGDVATIGRRDFLWAAVDYIAREADQSGPGDVVNASGFAHRYGEDGTAALLDVLRRSVGYISVQHRRAETEDEGGQTITAPVGTEDARFEEAGLVQCDRAAEHATCITLMDLDDAAFEDLTGLVEKKDAAARRACRAAPSTEQTK